MSLDVNISEPEEFDCVELHNCLKCVAEMYNIDDFIYHVDTVCGKSENYIANVFRVAIQETNSNKILSVIVKTLINTTRQELFRELHQREVNAYKEVIEKFTLLQNEILVNDRIVLPKFIFASTDKNNEVVILEDMQPNGFIMDRKLSKFKNLDYSQVHLIITELAKFHGLSYVMKAKDNNFKNITNNFKDLIYKDSFLNKTKLRNYVSDSFQMSLNLITNMDIKEKIETKKDTFIDVLRMYTKADKYSVFCHGDCWFNNILFKEEGDKKKICFLDFQTLRYANPVTDILFFLYLCTNSEFRSTYFEDLKIAYHETLTTFLNLFKIKADLIYSKEQFEKDLQEYMPFGLLVALLELRVVTTTAEDAMTEGDQLESDEAPLETLRPDQLYHSLVNDVVNESINNGVLNRVLDLIK